MTMTMTMTITFRRAVAIVLALAPTAACAKPVGQSTPSVQTRTDPAASGVTLQQFEKRHEERLLAADTDGDGRVSKAEFLAAAKAGKGDPAKRFATLDRNGDGMLDRSEIDAMLARRFKRLDTDGDGVASPSERAAAHAAKRQANKAEAQP